MTDLADPALTICFGVTVDGLDLGVFSSCEGLGVEMVLETREEGGNSLFVHQLPVRLKYPNIKLVRPLLPDTPNLARWFTRLAADGGRPEQGNATIQAFDSSRKLVAAWGLRGIVPVRWTGPQLNVEQAKVATETLELAHHGFTDLFPAT